MKPAVNEQVIGETLGGVPESGIALALTTLLARGGKRLLHIALNDRHMNIVANSVPFFAPEVEVLTLPAWDTLPYDRASPKPAIMAERLAALAALMQPSDKPQLILTTINAATQKLPPKSVMGASSFLLKPGTELNRDALLDYFTHNGYRRVGKAMEAGEYAVRGSIIDLIAPGMNEGVRLDVFGDELESLRRFDPLAQVSEGTLKELRLTPVNEVLLSTETIKRFRENYREAFGAMQGNDPLYESISEGRSTLGMEHYLPLFYESLDTLFDYVGTADITFEHQAKIGIAERHETIKEYFGARKVASQMKDAPPYRPVEPEKMFLMPLTWERVTSGRRCLTLSPFQEPGGKDFGLRTGRRISTSSGAPLELLKDIAEAAKKSGPSILLAAYSEGSRARLTALLAKQSIPSENVELWQEAQHVSKGKVGIAVLPVEQGFEGNGMLLLSEGDVLGERLIRTNKKKRKSDNFLIEAASFTEGELVVHKEHGIGRFDGLVAVEAAGKLHDCLKILYEGDDKLFLPVENMDLLSRFGTDEEGGKLDKLGGVSWQARKARMKERITLAAEVLMRTAAERALKEAAIALPAPGLYDEFVGRFPYMETEDQESAIEDVMEDLSAGKPMDRLICGDVGFGKTEVAMRAAFIAASAPEGPVQVALICPTTLLARQHFANFKERFSGLPLRIGMLSRLTNAKDTRDTKDGLKDGHVDIVIGTHALLGKGVEFKNLGLLIVDEEQHFGVAQKEKLKSLKVGVHVLTMTATPIPRTLQLSLSGVRDLSLITTPPVDRLAVRTFVMPWDDVVLREALMREFHRGGKSFVVTPRVKYMNELLVRLKTIVPEITVATAHGQMNPTELDNVMNAFYEGRADVLLSTTIVESGIDIPSANTLIIDRANMFGLSQLYQLRGRVGRSKTRAYAYLLLPHGKELGSNAVKRLEVMQTLDTLGAGFSLASHDMDIRGFGNLVGEEQSGHVREVGIELYQQMLEDAVNAVKAGLTQQPVKEDGFSPQINLGGSVLIPEDYVTDLPTRLGLYRRASLLENDADLESFAGELIDRFGPLPSEVEEFLFILRLKNKARLAGIAKIDAGPKGAVFTFHHNVFAKPDALIAYINKHSRHWKIRADQKLVLTRDWKNEKEKQREVETRLNEIHSLLIQ